MSGPIRNNQGVGTFPFPLSPEAVACAAQSGDQPSNHHSNRTDPTPLSLFVRERLNELGLKQAEFCRLHTFDQGMLSRIQNSMVFNLNLESVLRLSVGLQVSPRTILDLIGRPEWHDLIQTAYAQEWAN